MQEVGHGTTSSRTNEEKLENFIITSDLLIMNEDNGIPTFQSTGGRSWIGFTICNNLLAHCTKDLTCGEQVAPTTT